MSKTNSLSFLSTLVDNGTKFEQVEAIIAAMSPNLADDCNFLKIKIRSFDALSKFYGTRGQYYVSKEDDGSFALAAIVAADFERPVARTYYTLLGLNEIALIVAKRSDVIFVESRDQFRHLVNAAGAADRILAYKTERDSKAVRTVESFLRGRHDNTTVSESHFFDSNETCLICGTPQYRLMTTSFGDTLGAQAVTFYLCEKHYLETPNGFLLEFLARNFGFSLPFNISEIDRQSDPKLLEMAAKALTELGCTQIEIQPERRTLTGLRASTGFKIIVRLHRPGKDDYAYLIFDPDGNRVGKIDEAKHHPDLPVRWDHRHTALPYDNGAVEPSYTFGFPAFDRKAIEIDLLNAEREYFAKHAQS
jgi:hypothetical protein